MPLTLAEQVPVPVAGASPTTSRRTLPEATVFSVRVLAVRLTDTGPVAWKVSVARTRRPCRPHAKDRLDTVTRPLEEDEEEVDEVKDEEDDEVVGVHAGRVVVGVSPGISGSRLPKATPRVGVAKLGVGTTNVSVEPTSAVAPGTLARVTRAVDIAVAPLPIDGDDDNIHHAPKTSAIASTPIAPMMTVVRRPLSKPSAATSRCLPIQSPGLCPRDRSSGSH